MDQSNGILNILREVVAIPSRPLNEVNLFQYVLECVNKVGGNTQTMYRNGRPEYLLLIRDILSPYVITVHLDREFENTYVGEVQDFPGREKVFSVGNPDNALSVAIVLDILASQKNINVLFTTGEEVNTSWRQILGVMKADSLIPVSLDVGFTTSSSVLPTVVIPFVDDSGVYSYEVQNVLRYNSYLRKIVNVESPHPIMKTAGEVGMLYSPVSRISGGSIFIPVLRDGISGDSSSVYLVNWNTVTTVSDALKDLFK